jgi:hypothetical protein
LDNHCISELIEDPTTPYTAESQRLDPTVRVEFEYAYAIGGIGECIRATRHKNWGKGPKIKPLKPRDYVDEYRIIYCHKENSPMRMRYEQRKQIKTLLQAPQYRSLVSKAMKSQTAFLENLTAREAFVIRKLLNIEPRTFSQVVKGDLFIELPEANLELIKEVFAEAKLIELNPVQQRLFG